VDHNHDQASGGELNGWRLMQYDAGAGMLLEKLFLPSSPVTDVNQHVGTLVSVSLLDLTQGLIFRSTKLYPRDDNDSQAVLDIVFSDSCHVKMHPDGRRKQVLPDGTRIEQWPATGTSSDDENPETKRDHELTYCFWNGYNVRVTREGKREDRRPGEMSKSNERVLLPEPCWWKWGSHRKQSLPKFKVADSMYEWPEKVMPSELVDQDSSFERTALALHHFATTEQGVEHSALRRVEGRPTPAESTVQEAKISTHSGSKEKFSKSEKSINRGRKTGNLSGKKRSQQSPAERTSREDSGSNARADSNSSDEIAAAERTTEQQEESNKMSDYFAAGRAAALALKQRREQEQNAGQLS